MPKNSADIGGSLGKLGGIPLFKEEDSESKSLTSARCGAELKQAVGFPTRNSQQAFV